ncbi:MAG: isochorismatase family protein [Alphaproteobacteria bacterium]|nr:isochorismatase family protein [Alphaproteobacteria bacterium]
MTTSRLRQATSAVVVIDLQDRLVRSLQSTAQRARLDQALALRLIATRLAVPVLVTELDPRAFGPVLPALAGETSVSRTTLSAAPEITQWLTDSGRTQVALAGAELHVAVLQTALDLREAGLDVVVVLDATACRRTLDAELAVQRLAVAGVPPTTVETVAFEWGDDTRTPAFQDLLRQRR